MLLTANNGESAPVYSIASGLDYPGVGPEQAFLHEIGRVNYLGINDEQCLAVFHELSLCEGIIPALESAHALAAAMRIASQLQGETILVNLSGRGDKDLDFIVNEST